MFDRFPRTTRSEDAVWRRQASRSFDDLVGDLESGHFPRPTCPGEELALHLILEDAPAVLGDEVDWLEQHFAQLPTRSDDYDWDMAHEVLFQDHDILELFDPERDGIEDPDSEANQQIGMGDYRPAAWFKTFDNTTPRDGSPLMSNAARLGTNPAPVGHGVSSRGELGRLIQFTPTVSPPKTARPSARLQGLAKMVTLSSDLSLRGHLRSARGCEETDRPGAVRLRSSEMERIWSKKPRTTGPNTA
jgi:hypothetical protein